MEFRFTHRQVAEAREAISALHELQECLIKEISWAENQLEVIVKLAYIWTDAGEICFTVKQEPRQLTLRFQIVNEFEMSNALTEAMLQEPGRINWGISEIAKLAIGPAQDSDEFARAEFIWEWGRRIVILFRVLIMELSGAVLA
jgi:hypothetical protein